MDQTMITEIARKLHKCRSILFITGAGLSADSGLPTYRGIGGLYDQEVTEEGVPIEVALSGAMFQRDPGLTWKYLYQIEKACRGAKPNMAHHIIAELEQRFERVWVLTQNVDGFHRDAGTQHLIDIHGDVHRLVCTQCSERWSVNDYAGLDLPPRCARCSAIVRPEVVLFGEMLPVEAVRLLGEQLAVGFDAVFSIGTTSVFPYIAEPVLRARQAGALSVEINPGQSEVSDLVEYRVVAGAVKAMQAIREALPS